MKKVDYSEELLKIEDNTKYIPIEINGEMKNSEILGAKTERGKWKFELAGGNYIIK